MSVCDRWAMERMNIPQRLWEVSYQRLNPQLKTPVRRYCAHLDAMLHKGIGFLFVGPSGTGKTCGGIVLLKAAWERQKIGYFTTVKELRSALKENETFDGSNSIRERCYSVDLLVLDDLCADDFRNFTFGIGDVEHLLSVRSMRSKTTVLTTRLGIDHFQLEYPEIISTMRGRFLPVNCTGIDAKEQEAKRLLHFFGDTDG